MPSIQYWGVCRSHFMHCFLHCIIQDTFQRITILHNCSVVLHNIQDSYKISGKLRKIFWCLIGTILLKFPPSYMLTHNGIGSRCKLNEVQRKVDS